MVGFVLGQCPAAYSIYLMVIVSIAIKVLIRFEPVGVRGGLLYWVAGEGWVSRVRLSNEGILWARVSGVGFGCRKIRRIERVYFGFGWAAGVRS